MDGRYETVYDDNLCQLRAEFFYGRPGWREFLEKYPPTLSWWTAGPRSIPSSRAAPDWHEVYTDAGAALFLPQRENPVLSSGTPK